MWALRGGSFRAGAVAAIVLLGIIMVATSRWSQNASLASTEGRINSMRHEGGFNMPSAQEAIRGQKARVEVAQAPNRREDITILKDDLFVSPNSSSIQNRADHLHPDVWAKSLDLYPGAIAPNVHYFWCQPQERGRWFEFKHYLSVLSVIREINPHLIVFHYNEEPEVDSNMYNLWLDDLKKDVQFFVMKNMDDIPDFCTSDRDAQIKMILQVLDTEGGIYVSENTWLIDFPATKRLVDIEVSLDLVSLDGYIMMRKGMHKPEAALSEYFSDTTKNITRSACSPIHQVYHGDVKATCTNVIGERFSQFYPMNIWELDDPFGRLTRKLFYGTEEILKPEPTYDELVPNIGHMIWIGGGPMDFVFYLSLLSMLFVAKVDVVFIHGDTPPTGEYWGKLQSIERIRSRIKCIQTTPPLMVYQGVIEPWYRALMSDIIRVDLMIKYGGVYTDTDAIWTKPLSYEDRGYGAVACFDWVDWSYPYPDSVNFGISYGKKNAPFWRLFRESMRVLHNEHHGFTGVMYPYKILEKYPQLIRIDKRLSVICYHSRCHPIWVDDYHNMKKDHITEHNIPNWREDVHAFHWTFPNPTEYANETTLLASSGIFAEIGQNVLNLARL